jgi:hypothetical protein
LVDEIFHFFIFCLDPLQEIQPTPTTSSVEFPNSATTMLPNFLPDKPDPANTPSDIGSPSPLPTNTNDDDIFRRNAYVRRLEKQVARYKRKIILLRNQNKKLRTEQNKIKENLPLLLNDDQKCSLSRQTMRGIKWSDATMMKAYKLRLACGTIGYDVLREIGQPLPTHRTLQRRIEHLKFYPGLLNEVLAAMEPKVVLMAAEEKHCAILIDEMAITAKLDFDPSTSSILGKPTLPSSTKQYEDIATHGLVYMLAGVTSRWKQVVGYHFTGKSFDANSVKTDIDSLISKAEHMGLQVDGIISDMGGQNQAIWRLYNIHAGRHEVIKNSTPHPVDPSRKLYFHPDPPHIFKNLRGHLTNGQQIIIPESFVEAYCLPTNVVDISHIKCLLHIDYGDLKLAPSLTESCVKPSHFDKMKVGLAVRLLNHDTAAALRYCVERDLLHKEAITTAWFCETMHTWFKLVTSRRRTLALGRDNEVNYTNAIEFLQQTIYLFENIKIGPLGVWKPVQTGVLLASTNAIELAKFYLETKNFNFLYLGRFTQDALENLFSMVRFINPVPSPKFFKMALRIISVAQFFKPIRSGNYAADDSSYLIDFLNTKPIERIEEEPIPINDEEIEETSDEEIQSLYYLTGRTVHQLIVNAGLECTICLESLKTTSSDPQIAEFKRLTELKALSNKITYPSR